MAFLHSTCQFPALVVFIIALVNLNERVRCSPAQFGGTVFVGGWWDLREGIDGDNTPSRCEAALDNARTAGVQRLQFSPTFFWQDTGPIDPPEGFDPLCRGSDLSSYYCYNRFNATNVEHFCYHRIPEDHACDEVDETEIRVFQLLFGQCLQKAADMGFDIEINLRIDDGRSLEGWRNTLLMSPTEKYGNYSYETAFINPMLDLLEQIDYEGDLSFTVLGEMGASMMFYAEEWISIVDRARTRLDASRPATASKVKIGVQQNNAKICGCFEVGYVGNYREFLRALDTEFDPVGAGIDLEALSTLYLVADYLGISAYIPIEDPENMEECEFEGLLRRLDDELKFFNTSISKITESTRLHYSETGVGGGAAQDGKTPASTATEAAKRPYWGIQGPPSSNCDNDPFDMCSCDRVTGACSTENEVRDYRRKFYKEFSNYLLSSNSSCQYSNDIESIFIWSTGSWDVLGIYPPDRDWTDPVVFSTIEEHNRLATADPFG
jgi:hypothetical protein